MDSPKQGKPGYEFEFMKMPAFGWLAGILVGWLVSHQLSTPWHPEGRLMLIEVVGFMVIVALRKLNPIDGTLRFIVGCAMSCAYVVAILGS
jgi:hypothetical protein